MVSSNPQRRKRFRKPGRLRDIPKLSDYELDNTYRVCRVCQQEKALRYFVSCPECYQTKGKKCQACHIQGMKDSGYFERDKEKKASRGKAYYEDNKQKVNKKNALWRKQNKDRVKAYNAKQYAKRDLEKTRAYAREYSKKREAADTLYKIAKRIRTRIVDAVSRDHVSRSGSTERLLGCSVERYLAHVESTWTAGMSWDNYGVYTQKTPDRWHIDHVVPISSFDLTKPEEQQKAFHWSNTQALWGRENISKGAKNLCQDPT